MSYILIGVLVALAAIFMYSAMTPTGMDWKKGMAALVALGAAIWAWIAGLFSSAPPV
ncbi:MAG: hypothetical protein RJA36_314 [Pseudomonadota bacterium]|jgi:hypothetical protein